MKTLKECKHGTKKEQQQSNPRIQDLLMSWPKDLKESLCLGRLIWIQAPSQGDSVHYAKKVLNSLGFLNGEMPFITASEFLFCCQFGFLFHMTIRSRVLLIGGIDQLEHSKRAELVKYLQKAKDFKMMYELNLVVIDSLSKEMAELLAPVKPMVSQPFADSSEPELNELVQDWLEEASTQFGKKVYGLSSKAADFIEELSAKNGLELTKIFIFQSVMSMKGRVLKRSDLLKAYEQNKFDLLDIGLTLEKNEIF